MNPDAWGKVIRVFVEAAIVSFFILLAFAGLAHLLNAD